MRTIFRGKISDYVDENWNEDVSEMILLERNRALHLFFLTTDENQFINIWAWPIDVTLSDIEKKVNFFQIKNAYHIAQTSTKRVNMDGTEIKMRLTIGGQYLTWFEEDYNQLRSVRLCSHTEYFSEGKCFPCEYGTFSPSV